MSALAQPAVTAIARPALDNKRVAAAVIDLFVVFFVGFLLGILAGGYTPAAGAISTAWALYYYFAFESLTGQTLGKKAMGLRVASVDGSPPEMRQIAIRSVLRLIDGFALYLVGLITMLASGERRQRLGDLAAKTIVTTVEVERQVGSLDELPDAPVVPFHPPDPEHPIPEPPEPKPEPPPAAVEEPPPFEPYRVPDQPAAAAVQAAPPPEPYTPAEEPRIELVPDPPAEGEEPRIKIVSPMDVVMGEDDEDEPPPPPQSA